MKHIQCHWYFWTNPHCACIVVTTDSTNKILIPHEESGMLRYSKDPQYESRMGRLTLPQQAIGRKLIALQEPSLADDIVQTVQFTAHGIEIKKSNIMPWNTAGKLIEQALQELTTEDSACQNLVFSFSNSPFS